VVAEGGEGVAGRRRTCNTIPGRKCRAPGTVQRFQPEPDIHVLTFVNLELAAMRMNLSEIEVSDNSSSSFDVSRHFRRDAGREGLAPMEGWWRR
jgi:hypothetical protein